MNNQPPAPVKTAQVLNTEKCITVSRSELPICCPRPGLAVWNAHPRVYLPLGETSSRQVTCPYCSTVFVLAD